MFNFTLANVCEIRSRLKINRPTCQRGLFVQYSATGVKVEYSGGERRVGDLRVFAPLALWASPGVCEVWCISGWTLALYL